MGRDERHGKRWQDTEGPVRSTSQTFKLHPSLQYYYIGSIGRGVTTGISVQSFIHHLGIFEFCDLQNNNNTHVVSCPTIG